MLDLLITTVGVMIIYYVLFYCIKNMKLFVIFMLIPNFVIMLVILYGNIGYQKLDLWKYPDEYQYVHKTTFLPIKSIKNSNFDYETTDGVYSIVEKGDYSKKCLHHYYVKKTSDCPMTDVILETTQTTHNNYIEQKLSESQYLYYTRENKLDGKLYEKINKGASVTFESTFSAKDVQTIFDTEEKKKSDPFNNLKKYANYCDQICLVFVLMAFFSSFYEPPDNKRINANKIMSWICHSVVFILLAIRYSKYLKVKDFLKQNKDEYKDYLPIFAFNLETVPFAIQISIFCYYILYLICPKKCHQDECNNDNVEQACLTNCRAKFFTLILPIFIGYCFIIVYDVLNDILIEENYKIIQFNWTQNSLKSIGSHKSYGGIYEGNKNDYNYFDVAARNDDDTKICGKDSQDNDLYFPNDVECPINDIFISQTSSTYDDYTEVHLNSGEYLYYTNKKTTGRIAIGLIEHSSDNLTIDSGLSYDEYDKIDEKKDLRKKLGRFKSTYFYKKLGNKLYVLNYLGVSEKLTDKVHGFKENLDKYKKLKILKYASYAINVFDFYYYSCLFILEKIVICYVVLGIFLLATAAYVVIINLWCLAININYIQLFMNIINEDFENNRCTCGWNILLTLIGILCFIYYIVAIVRGFIGEINCCNCCDNCCKKQEKVSPYENKTVIVRFAQDGNYNRDTTKRDIKLEKEFKSVKEPICLACLNNNAIITLSPCGHKCLCESCFNNTNSSESKKCPLCREDYSVSTE